MRFQVWTDFNARIALSNQLTINAEPGYRIEPESGIQTAYLRAAVRYTPIKLISLDFGVADFNTWGSDLVNSVELRTFEYFFLNVPEFWDFKLKLRLGLEQRWFNFRDLEIDRFVHRGRLRAGLTSPSFAFWQGNSKLYVTANYELLRNVNENILDFLLNQNRLMLGLGIRDGRNFRGELHYQIMKSRDHDLDKLVFNVNLVRIRLYYYFKTGNR